MPFFGEGERRSLAANFNIRDTKEQVKKSLKTKNLLATAIAIPINLKKKIKDYQQLTKNILSIK